MKKSILFVAAIAALSFTSCKKDRTCTCTTTYTNKAGVSSTSVSITEYKKVKKSEARSWGCVSSTDISESGTTTVNDCKLK